MWTTIAGIIGLITTILAWFLNPSRKREEELNNIYDELDLLYTERDKALKKNDSDSLTVVTARINVLRARKNSLFQ